MKYLYCFVLILIYSCGSSSDKIQRPSFEPEKSIEELLRLKLVSINDHYKSEYFRLIPYLFNNNNDNFLKINGDFYNLKYGNSSHYNIIPAYYNEYGKYRNAITVLIRKSDPNKPFIDEGLVAVISSEYGIFDTVVL
jgi:hypothetical protein